MTWDGYFEYGGTEVINVARTEAYIANAGHTWFRPAFNNTSLAYMLGDGLTYGTPLIDEAPWVDPDFPESLDFYGFYPLDVSGIEDSSRTSTVIESLGDGGVPGRLRNTTKTLVFNGLILAGSECAATYGLRWLKRALLDGVCGTGVGSTCNGMDLCYLDCAPEIDLPSDDAGGVHAILDGGSFLTDPTFTVLNGGTVSSTGSDSIDGGSVTEPGVGFLSGGGVASEVGVIEVQVDSPDIDGGGMTPNINHTYDGGTPSITTGLASASTWPFIVQKPYFDPQGCLTPYERSLRKVLVNTGPSLTTKRQTSDGAQVWTVQFTAVAGNPWELSAEVPVVEGFMDPTRPSPWVGDTPVDGVIDLDGYIHSESDCAVVTYQAVTDPLHPAMVAPPGPPSVPLGYYVPPLNWRRRQFTIPASYVPLWGEVVPKVSIHARDSDLRNLRLRFYVDPFEVGDISDDPCAYCGDIVVSYIPEDHTLILDGAEQAVYIVSPGGVRRRADSLVFATDGTPFEWPALTCGFGYVVTVDLPQTQAPPAVDLSLFARSV